MISPIGFEHYYLREAGPSFCSNRITAVGLTPEYMQKAGEWGP